MNSPLSAAPSLPAAFQDIARRYPGTVAIRFAGRDTTLQQFDQASDSVAAGLAAQGIEPGDRVALYCVNSDVFAFAYAGIIKAGATVVPINLLLNPNEINYILNDAGCRGLIYHEAFAASVDRFRTGLRAVQTFIYIGSQPSADDDLPWTALIASGARVPDITFDPGADVASILYTSGTTGRPKGAMLTHRNLLSNVDSVVRALAVDPGEDSFLVVLPMFHAFAATVGMLLPLLHGCTFVPVPKFEPKLVMDTIADSGATIFLGVPSMYTVLLNLPEEMTARFASVRLCVSGGAAMPQEVMRKFEQRYNVPVHEGDGPTECSPVTCVNPIHGERKPGSVGPPIPGVEMSIRDENGGELADEEMGEICVRGPNVMKGYWNLPDETAAAFFGDWFRTGDLGYRDGDGYFYIVDRIKDMIIVNGMNVYPRAVEEVLYQHPSVLEAAVVGKPDKLHGEIPVAFVVVKENETGDANAIRAFCREHIGKHQVPRKVIFLPELPKNAAGKILKRELRKHGELERGIEHAED